MTQLINDILHPDSCLLPIIKPNDYYASLDSINNEWKLPNLDGQSKSDSIQTTSEA